MDRFIVVDEDSGNYALIDLKSNMDRFIEVGKFRTVKPVDI